MGQAHLCQPGPPPGAGDRLRKEEPWLGDYRTQDKLASIQQQYPLGMVETHEWDSDASAGSEAEDGAEGSQTKGRPSRPPSRLVLKRQRVFSPHLQLKFKNFYKIEKHIGEGSYGSVFEALTLDRLGQAKSSGSSCDASPELGVPAAASPVSEPTPKSTGGDVRRVAVKIFKIPVGKKAKQCACGETFVADADSCRKCGLKRPEVAQDGQDESPRTAERAQREALSRKASFERERHILSQLEHPHIVRMFECFEERSALYIVMELCYGGELYVRIVKKARESRGVGGGFEEQTARSFFRQMLFATSYLHAHRIVHRDIKTENFLLLGEAGTPEGEMIKLCDFGTAVQLTETQPRAMERIGTLSYTAPEIYVKEGADTVADAWSLGVVLYVLLVGASPFRTTGEEPREETIRRIKSGEFDQTRHAWKSLSSGGQDIIQSFLVVKEEKRLSSANALRHHWVEPRSAGTAMAPVVASLDGSRSASPRQLSSPRSSRVGSLTNFAKFAPSVVMLITRFVHLHAMQQLALLVCAQMLAEADLVNRQMTIPWYELFFALDADEDGRLSFGEFSAGLSFLMGGRSGLSQEHFYALVRAMDVDCSGSVDWIEWVAVALLSIAPEALDKEPLCTAFRLLDRPSGDGMIGAADILAVINTDASGACLSATRGRKRVIKLLNRWSRHSQDLRGSKGAASYAPPSLSLEDFRQLLKSTTGQVRAGEEEVSAESIMLSGILSQEAAMINLQNGIPLSNGAGFCPTSQIARPLSPAVAFPWCQCQQPTTYVGSEEVVKAENVFVQQQSVVPSSRPPVYAQADVERFATPSRKQTATPDRAVASTGDRGTSPPNSESQRGPASPHIGAEGQASRLPS